jgi:3-dehydroquinate synthetase
MTQPFEEIPLILGNAVFPLCIGWHCIDEIVGRISRLHPDRILLLTDRQVAELHGQPLFSRLNTLVPVMSVLESPGERVKSLALVDRIAEDAISWGITRQSVVVAFGGGAIGNLAGLVAALLFRGIRLLHIPTTLLAALDSVISLKQAVNSRSGKNLIGTYYAPEAVFIDLAFLGTLPVREIRSALCEVVKNALAVKPEMMERLRSVLRPHCLLHNDDLEWIVRENINAKADVLREDGFEKHSGLRFEYGHTIGHALEYLDERARAGDGLSHGESIGYGCVMAAYVSVELGFMQPDFAELHRSLILQAGCAGDLPTHVSSLQIEQLLSCDNKRGLTSESPEYVSMVLLRAPGMAVGPAERPLTPVPISIIREVLKRSKREGFAKPFPNSSPSQHQLE